MIYTKDRTQRITVRFTQPQFDFILRSASVLSVSPSDFLRMMINGVMASEISTLEEMEANCRENEVMDNSNQL